MIVPADQYYITRDAAHDYSDYWEPSVDPDGVLRDRLSEAERRQHLADVANELAFVRGLAPGRILDVGCGPGWFLSELDGWARYGTEVCETAAQRARDAGVNVVERYSRMRCDVIRCHHVIEHLPNPEAEMERIRFASKRGAWLLLSTPDFGSPCAARFGDRYRMLHDQTHCSLFTLESVSRFVRDYGFEIARVDFPFPERYATAETMERWAAADGVSPAWPGNWMTLYCQRT